jgi:hypothetical protein
LANPINIPVKVLDVKVGLIIDAAGRVLDAKLYDESPTLIEHPELKDTLDGLVDQAFMSSDTLFKVKFEVQNEASQDLLAYRIARVRFRVVQ